MYHTPSLRTLFLIFLKLGCICFGGPLAALGYFHREFVERRKWLDEKAYMDLVVLCQSLPGPVSSQVAIAIGFKVQGMWGGVIALLGFILPSTLVLTLAGLGVHFFSEKTELLHGLKIAVAVVVAQALLIMRKRFCPDSLRMAIGVVSAIIAFSLSGFAGQVTALAIGALTGVLFLQSTPLQDAPSFKITISKRTAYIACMLFFSVLGVGPIISIFYPNHLLDLFNTFYQTGALVFGGGHVVLALLQTKVVETGWVDPIHFLSGYGLVQAMPGPLFCFAAYLGAVMIQSPNGWVGALFCTFSIFLPSFLIMTAILPWWEEWRHHYRVQTILSGLCAAMWGLLFAIFIDPVLTSSITSIYDFAIALAAFILLEHYRMAQWLIVLLCALVYAL